MYLRVTLYFLEYYSTVNFKIDLKLYKTTHNDMLVNFTLAAAWVTKN